MNFYTLALGLFMFLHGSYILLSRARATNQQKRLNFMRKMLGRPLGFSIYSLIYVVLPVGVGIYIILAGLNGVELTTLFTAPN